MTIYYEEYETRLSVEDHNWTARAACEGQSSLMYPSSMDEQGVQLAKLICAQCPVRDICMNEALNNGEQFGVWGGLTAEERWDLLRKRGTKVRKWTHLRPTAGK